MSQTEHFRIYACLATARVQPPQKGLGALRLSSIMLAIMCSKEIPLHHFAQVLYL